MNNPISTVCLDFDGTIMRYDNPPEHFHPLIIAALNHLETVGVEWVAHSGRSFRGQMDVLTHSMAAHGLTHRPVAICHSETYIHVWQGSEYVPLMKWNDQATTWLHALQAQLRGPYRLQLESLIDRHAPDGVYYREDATVFQMSGPDARRVPFVTELNQLLQQIPSAAVVNNGEWIAVIDERLGKGNVLRAYLEYRELSPQHVLAVGDHGNDLSMLDGTVTPNVACPGDAYAPVRQAVQHAGGFIAQAFGPLGTYEAFQHFFAHDTTWPDLEVHYCSNTIL